jgi:hypothetical protein
MEYMFLINSDETLAPDPASPTFGDFMAEWMAYNKKLVDGGHYVNGGRLAPSGTATTLNRSNGDTVIDGPFAETKEQFGGWYVISAADLDEAIELAKAMPIDRASIEVRPVAFRSDPA